MQAFMTTKALSVKVIKIWSVLDISCEPKGSNGLIKCHKAELVNLCFALFLPHTCCQEKLFRK